MVVPYLKSDRGNRKMRMRRKTSVMGTRRTNEEEREKGSLSWGISSEENDLVCLFVCLFVPLNHKSTKNCKVKFVWMEETHAKAVSIAQEMDWITALRLFDGKIGGT
jgi:hypothetical protein